MLLPTNLLFLLSSITTSTLANHHQLQHPFQLLHPSPDDTHDPTMSSKSLNVLRTPLALHSTSPMTGFLRNGYCEVPPSDYGNHAVAAEVTDEFLDFSASRGNDLRTVGLKGGCKWCLCASRWLEAFEAKGGDPRGEKIVPKVYLEATNESALKKIDLEVLRKYAVEKK
ncbi:hypothetical protein BDZ85DRAFT_263767 [Elsinoe ampelina]|uniref:Uncharacterized protein n=1 Tax=Elsinoe ampelina TaxID=302913 RepID=A0A6A6G9W3_9PEZI|nr:hypothetical protein BDZ85DRAFT_263767 [Elsinoe ampelina]